MNEKKRKFLRELLIELKFYEEKISDVESKDLKHLKITLNSDGSDSLNAGFDKAIQNFINNSKDEFQSQLKQLERFRVQILRSLYPDLIDPLNLDYETLRRIELFVKDNATRNKKAATQVLAFYENMEYEHNISETLKCIINDRKFPTMELPTHRTMRKWIKEYRNHSA